MMRPVLVTSNAAADGESAHAQQRQSRDSINSLLAADTRIRHALLIEVYAMAAAIPAQSSTPHS